MNQSHDLELIFRSRTPLIVIETREEARLLELLQSNAISRTSDTHLPLFRWTVTDGLQRVDILMQPQVMTADPTEALKHIRAVSKPGIYALLDFHPFINDPIHVRLIKDICIRYADVPRRIVMISDTVSLPRELEPFSARFDMGLPTEAQRHQIIESIADEWRLENPGSRVQADAKAYKLLIRNLAGLTHRDTERLARNAIYHDGAITRSDLPEVMKAKYKLLNSGGALHFEHDTARFNDVGGLKRLKAWLAQRKAAFRGDKDASHLDAPKGILLLGVQGCGKSLAAKATAAIFGVPLLRLDFGSIYDKYHGETERKLRESLKTADVMSPCVLWIDEIEKGIAGRGGETGTTQRVLGTFLTWMSEKKSQVFVVATANDISSLPPELVRKGRFDEIFFVDLPDTEVRASIMSIHLNNRGLKSDDFDIGALATATDGFSGAEIEQAIVAALYAAHGSKKALATSHILNEIRMTKPLSIVMHEKIDGLRRWAERRTVPCD